MKFYLAFLIGLLYPTVIFSQGVTIKGIVYLNNGRPAPFVTVDLLQTSLHAVTDTSGFFVINDVIPMKYALLIITPKSEIQEFKINTKETRFFTFTLKQNPPSLTIVNTEQTKDCVLRKTESIE